MIDTVDVALFPIPNMVSFPGTKVPLHVFEPRYRLLIKDAVRDKRLVGVCHVKKKLKSAPKDQSSAEKLRTNQDTYEPFTIFSAGFCEITDITDDGRIYAEVTMESRYEFQSIQQDIPYKIVQCRPYTDNSTCDPEDNDIRTEIDRWVLDYSSDDQGLMQRLQSPSWIGQSTSDYSFTVFQILRFEPEVMQNLLECQSPKERLEQVLQALKGMASK